MVLLDALGDGTGGASTKFLLVASWSWMFSSLSALFLVLGILGAGSVSVAVMAALVLVEGVNILQ